VKKTERPTLDFIWLMLAFTMGDGHPSRNAKWQILGTEASEKEGYTENDSIGDGKEAMLVSEIVGLNIAEPRFDRMLQRMKGLRVRIRHGETKICESCGNL
jgi:hypothetical protein